MPHAGSLALSRFHSKHLALRRAYFLMLSDCEALTRTTEIKAIEEGVFGERYSIVE